MQMVDLVHYLTHLLLFDISLLYYYISLRSSIIFCLSAGDIYFNLGILFSLIIVSELFSGEILKKF